MTKLEERLLKFITGFISEHRHSPTLQQMGEALEIKSRGTLHRYVQSLVTKKYLRRSGRGWRAVTLSKTLERSLTILPMHGQIEAKKPIEKIPDMTEINFSGLLLGPERYVLKVIGDTMISAGILNNDLLILQKTNTAKNGDIVVALIDNAEVTLKRLRHHGDRIELVPDNPTLAPMIYPTSRVHIQGVVVGQVRIY